MASNPESLGPLDELKQSGLGFADSYAVAATALHVVQLLLEGEILAENVGPHIIDMFGTDHGLSEAGTIVNALDVACGLVHKRSQQIRELYT